jgi:UDP-glucose 4-epimerase
MRVVVVGASGNVGTSLLEALRDDGSVSEIVAVARRPPATEDDPSTSWVRADVVDSPLEPIFRGADAVVHLAWAIQPSRDEAALERVNVRGSQRVFDAAAAVGVPTLVYASSIGAYSPGPKDRPVDERHPTHGIQSSFYSRHKAATERMLDRLEDQAPEMRVVRLRPGLIFKREAAEGIRRYFVGPLLPSPLVRRPLIPLVPSHPRLVVQAVHADDVAQAYRVAITDERARGAYNVATEPVLHPGEIAGALGARTVPVPAAALRTGAWVTWKARLQPTPPGWVDMGLGVPVMDTARIRTELGWAPRLSASEALLELTEGLRDRAGGDTPVLGEEASGPLRIRELLSGVGRRNP